LGGGGRINFRDPRADRSQKPWPGGGGSGRAFPGADGDHGGGRAAFLASSIPWEDGDLPAWGADWAGSTRAGRHGVRGGGGGGATQVRTPGDNRSRLFGGGALEKERIPGGLLGDGGGRSLGGPQGRFFGGPFSPRGAGGLGTFLLQGAPGGGGGAERGRGGLWHFRARFACFFPQGSGLFPPQTGRRGPGGRGPKAPTPQTAGWSGGGGGGKFSETGGLCRDTTGRGRGVKSGGGVEGGAGGRGLFGLIPPRARGGVQHKRTTGPRKRMADKIWAGGAVGGGPTGGTGTRPVGGGKNVVGGHVLGETARKMGGAQRGRKRPPGGPELFFPGAGCAFRRPGRGAETQDAPAGGGLGIAPGAPELAAFRGNARGRGGGIGETPGPKGTGVPGPPQLEGQWALCTFGAGAGPISFARRARCRCEAREGDSGGDLRKGESQGAATPKGGGARANESRRAGEKGKEFSCLRGSGERRGGGGRSVFLEKR